MTSQSLRVSGPPFRSDRSVSSSGYDSCSQGPLIFRLDLKTAPNKHREKLNQKLSLSAGVREKSACDIGSIGLALEHLVLEPQADPPHAQKTCDYAGARLFSYWTNLPTKQVVLIRAVEIRLQLFQFARKHARARASQHFENICNVEEVLCFGHFAPQLCWFARLCTIHVCR